jgi:hypothetical protein
MRNHVWLLLLLIAPVLVSAQTVQSDSLFVFSIEGAITCMSPQGHPVFLERLHKIPDGVTVDMGPGAVMRVFAEKNLFGEFFGPRVMSFTDLRKGIKIVTGERDKRAGSIWGNIVKKLYEYVHSLTAEIVDTMTPAAVRGDLEAMNEARLIPLSPRNGNVTGDTVQFVWHSGAEGQTHVLRISDEESEQVFSVQCTGESLAINPKRVGLKPGGMYTWSVSGAVGLPGESPFRLSDLKAANAMRDELRIADEFAGGDQVSAHMARAAVYEQHECYGNAYFELRAAVRADTSSAMKVIFTTFMIERLGLTRPDIEAAFPELVEALTPVEPVEASEPR